MTTTTLPADLEQRLGAQQDPEVQLDAVFELLAAVQRQPQLSVSAPMLAALWHAMLRGADEDEALLSYAGEALTHVLGHAALVEGLVERLAASQPVEVRAQAARALAELGDATALDALQASLADPEPAVRAAAAGALARVARGSDREPAVRERLLAVLANEQDEPLEVRRAVAAYLRELPSEETVTVLLELLADKHGDEELQANALRTLSYEPEASKRVVKALCRILNTWRRETAVKVEAARTLAYTQHEQALPTLVEHLADGNPAVRAACAEALGHFELPELIEPLAEVLHNPLESAAIRRLAALSIGQIGSAPHVPDEAAQLAAAALLDMLEEMTEDDESAEYVPELTVSLADALGRFGGEPIAAALRFLLEMDELEVREAALRAYARQAVSERVTVLRTVLEQGRDEEMRVVAAEALAQLADPASEETLLGVLEDADEFIRARAVHGLGRIQSRKAVQPLLAWLAEPATPGGLVYQALDALGRIGDAAALPALEHAFATEASVPVRTKAAGALTRFGKPEARTWLHEHAAQTDGAHARESFAAALELAELGDAAAVPVLLARLAPRHGDEVRLKAVQALRHLPEDATALAALEAMSDQPDVLLRDAARGLWP